MPHIIVEHSTTLDIDIAELADALHDALAGISTVNPATIKTRTIAVQNAVIGNRDKADKLLHITLRLLPGRDDALKKTMAQSLFEVAYKQCEDQNASVTVETVELHEATYTQYSQARRASDAT